MDKKRNVPEIRFAGFTDDWEQRKLGDILSESRIYGSNGKNANKLTVKLWGKGVVAKDDLLQGSEATQYFIRKAGQFIYGKLDFLNQAFGIIPDKLDGYESTLDAPAFDIDTNVNSNFLLEYISRENFYLHYGNLANGSRKAKRVHTNVVLDMPFIAPSFEEQTAIGNFFKQLDETIDLHQREYEKYKNLKISYLEKMFPKENEQFPELRFPEFTDAWEQRKLGEIGIFNPHSEIPDIFEYVDLEAVIGTELLFHRTENKYTAPSRARRRAKKGDLFYQAVRPYQKNNYLFDLDNENYVFSTGYIQIRPAIDSYFLLSKVQEDNFVNIVLEHCTGTSYPAINSTDLANIEIKIPKSAEEQTAIGNFFKQLDETIDLHQREVEKYKQIKQSYLEKMFI
ncbi:TPA: restriction endonuclease subunit S [Mannheimia haemolytica]